MLDYTNRQSALLAGKQSNASIEEDGPYTQKYKVDLKGRGAGTYYVNLDKETYQKIAGEADKLHIYKDADQTLVFNVNAEGDLGIQKYSVNGKGSDSYLTSETCLKMIRKCLALLSGTSKMRHQSH